MSTTAVSTPPTSRVVAASAAARSLPTRAITVFSGTAGVATKIALLSVVNAIAVWAAVILLQHGNWKATIVLATATAAIDAIYLGRRTVPAKFLVPGTIFLLAFQVIPIAYTINIAFTNYSTGHILSKAEAIDGIKGNSLSPPPNGKQYTMTPAKDADGNLVLLLRDDDSGKTFVGTRDGLKPLAGAKVSSDGFITAAAGYALVTGPARLALDKELSDFTVPTTGSSAVRPEGLETAVELEPTLRYDAKRDEFVRISDGKVFRDNGHGSFVAGGEELEPGWKTTVGTTNFSRLVHNPLVRRPFLRVFAWTFAFAALTVFVSFALGLFLAIALDKPGMRFQRTYRSIMVLPYAIPPFLSLLVWSGLLNDDFGVVNKLLGHLGFTIPWLYNPWWAKVSVIVVSIWLTTPYFFLVSMGALQSIPGELVEAARVDGGGAWATFRRVTLPLLLVAVAPLMIASFAFNFNNFGNIYFLTGGGPASNDNSIAGATDILISYTYKLSFASGKGGDYGLASTVAIVIFVIIAVISATAFSRTKALENLN